MRLKWLTVMGALAVCIPVCAAPQDVPASHWAAPAVKSVTQKKLMTTGTDGQFHGDRPVTRYELAVVLDRFVRYMEQGRKPLSQVKPVSIPMAKVIPAAPARALSHLVDNGFLPVNTPLYAKDGTHPATAQETADAMAQVVAQLSSRALPPTAH